MEPSNSAPIESLEETVKKKQQAKYDVKLETELKEWIESTLHKKMDDKLTFQENLKSGILLCEYVFLSLHGELITYAMHSLYHRLLNTLCPGAVKRINTSTLAFKQMVFSIFTTSFFIRVVYIEHYNRKI